MSARSLEKLDAEYAEYAEERGKNINHIRFSACSVFFNWVTLDLKDVHAR
jgi:hypothetical protein